MCAVKSCENTIREVSSAGRASDLHSEGQRFESFTSHHFGGVAQLVRAIACHAIGRGFESLHSRHFPHVIIALNKILGKNHTSVCDDKSDI